MPSIGVPTPFSFSAPLPSDGTAELPITPLSFPDEPLLSSLLTSPGKDPSSPLAATLTGAFQLLRPQPTPVKDLICKGFFSHFRQGFPVRSSARRLALILPAFAFGPRRAAAAADVGFALLAAEAEWSIVPSGLHIMLAFSIDYSGIRCQDCTYSLGFFFGPGLPLSLIGPFGSMLGGALFLPLTPPAAAPPRFLRPSTLGGGASALASGMGVEFDSDVLSAADVVSGTEGEALVVGGGREGLGVESDGKSARSLAGRWRVMVSDFLAALVFDMLSVSDVGVDVVVGCS